MKIDLHLHSNLSGLNGDSIKWTKMIDAINSMYKRDVKAFSFTDHNAFSAESYFLSKKLTAGHMHVFPGVEVDVIRPNGVRAHLLIIFNNQIPDESIMEIEKICRNSLRKNGISISNVNNLFKDYETIRIPHVGKSEHFKPDELDELIHDSIETTSYENVNYKNWIKTKNNKSVVAFSDTHVWRDYPQQEALYTDIDFDGSFEDLKTKLAVKQDYTKKKL